MEDCMRECMRKLALWHTRTFRPLATHDDLELILATMGFVGLPPSQTGSTGAWKEYVFSASTGASAHGLRSYKSSTSETSSTAPPRPRLPYPRIDGLHIYTYRAFIDAVNFYLDMWDISDLFHIRGMPLHRISDRNRAWKWRCMEEDDSVFVYREGTLEQATYNFYHFGKHGSCNMLDSVCIRDKGTNNNASSSIVSLKDVIVFL